MLDGFTHFTKLAAETIKLVDYNYKSIFVDGLNEGDSDGSQLNPFASVSEAVTAMTADTSASGFVLYLSHGAYTESSVVAFPDKPIVIYGNGATVTASAGVTFANENVVIRDLTIAGNATFSNADVGRVVLSDSAITGTTTANGRTDAIFCGIKDVVVASTAQVLLFGCTKTGVVTSEGIYFEYVCNTNTGKATPLITSTAGYVVVNGSILMNTSTGGAISCDNGADGTIAANYVTNSIIVVASGSAIAADDAYLVFNKNMVTGTVSGTNIIGAADVIGVGTMVVLGSDATGDMYYRAATTGLLTRIPKGTDGQVLKMVSGVPAWATA